MGPGDDGAVLAMRPGRLCVTTDAVVEGVHFRRADGPLEDVGHKALAVNLSDLAAMGARPAWFVCALAAPALPKKEVLALARGMAALARRFSVALVGGNVSRAGELSLTLTAFGPSVATPLLRSGGHPGDFLYVSGTLGAACLGLQSLRNRRPGGRYPLAERRQRRPEPRVALGLLASRYARAAIDVSDGFLKDLGRLLTASGVGAEVETARLPVDPDVRRAFSAPARALSMALEGGEDYELLLAVPRARAPAFERACARAGQAVAQVGKLVPGQGVHLVDAFGRRSLARAAGFDHFVRPKSSPHRAVLP